MVAVVVVAAAAVGTVAYRSRTGPALNVGAFKAGTATQPGEWAHVFVPLWTHSGTVSLTSARAIDVSGHPEIQFSVVRPKPSAVGTLSTLTGGTLVALGFHPEKVDGADVHARITNGPVIYIVLSMRASTSGIVGVQAIDITYRSLRHTRRVHSSVVVCDSVAAGPLTDDSGCS